MSDKPVKKQKGFSYVQLSSGKRGPGRPAGWKKFAIPTAIVSALLIVALLVTITALVVTFTRRGPIQPPVPTRRCDLSSYERFDCLPGIAEPRHDTCLDVGCCWNESETPFCYYSSESGYTVEDKFQYTQVGIRGCLTAKKSSSTAFGESLQRVCVNITFETEDRLHVKLYDPAVERYEVPLDVPIATSKAQQPRYKIMLINDTFSFSVLRREGSRKELFRVAHGLVFADQFIQLSAYLPTRNIYGLGEHVTSLRLPTDNATFTMFAADIFPNPDIPAQNLYGVHPFYLALEEDGQAHGVLLLNSNAMDVTLQNTPSITYRTIGGVLDFYFFMGPSPEQVVQQYTEVIGRPFFPPYWSLGFHLCRWGYDSANNTWNVVKRMRELGIPQDVQWSDIDYMHNHLDFSYDHETFGELPDLIDDLHDHGQKYVVITDPGISNHEPNGTYAPYNDGLEMNIFVRNSSGGLLVGRVWPDLTVYPDFLHPNASLYWEQQIRQFHKNISFDGLWIDMNEPSNFVAGSLDGCVNSSSLDHPPYLPGTIKSSGIFHKTLCMSSKQHLSSHYNVHSLYGHTEAKATMNALQELLGERSIVISRSTFVGSGRYTGHWLGDNASQWKHMANSIPGILHFSLFGIPLVGADICGFFDTPSEELCVRWQQLGSFYPFSRNHNIRDTEAQDPTVWSSEAVHAIRRALLLRYSIIPYLYTLFHSAHVNGSTVARPLFFNFPTDSQTWAMDTQFMWGSALLISPVLEKNASFIDVYLPPSSRWFFINSTLPSEDTLTAAKEAESGHVTIPVSLSSLPLHIRGGSILPLQKSNTTTFQSRQNPFSLVVALDGRGKGCGEMFIDDGKSLTGAEDGLLLKFTAEEGMMTSSIERSVSDPVLLEELNTQLAQVFVLGLPDVHITEVTLNGSLQLNHTINRASKVLTVTFEPHTQHITSPFTMSWRT